MKKYLLLVSLFSAFNAFGGLKLEDRLYCYGTIFSGNDYIVELKEAINNDGTEREVYFAKNVHKESKLVAKKCHHEDEGLVCEWKKGKVIVNSQLKYHQGMWDASSYSYYEATVSHKTLFGTHTEVIRCR